MVLTTFDSFEDGNYNEWNNISSVSSSVSVTSSFSYDGSQSLSCSQSSADDFSLLSRSVSWGKTSKARFYYRETESNNAGGLAFFDSNNNHIFGAGTDNPEFLYADSDGTKTRAGSEGEYKTWTQVTFDFDWGSGTVDITWDQTVDGGSASQTVISRSLASTNGIAELRIGTIQDGNDIVDFWVDNIQYDPPITDPSAPRNLSASSGSFTQTSLSWDEPSDWGGDDTDSYRIYRGTSSGSHSQIDTVSNQTTYTDSGLSQGEKYYYVVTAYNSAGSSPDSNEASATTPLPAPSNLSGSWSP
jgi:hypothetical protein